MSHAGNIITSPVDLRGDIAVVLAKNSGDLGTLYNANEVNMWSKKKPVDWHLSSLFMDHMFPQENHPNDWFKGYNGDYGIVSKSFNNISPVYAAIDGDKNGWVYQRDPVNFRALDFDGYYHAARNPFEHLYVGMDRTSVAPNGELTFEYQYSEPNIDTDHEIGITDIYCYTPAGGGKRTLGNMYLAFLIYHKVNGAYSYYGWTSIQETLSSLATDPAMHHLSYTVPNTQGDYQVIPVLTEIKKENENQAISSVVTIPGTGILDFVVSQNVIPYMQVDAFVYNIGTGQAPNYNNTIYFYCTFFGGTNGGQFSNIKLAFETSNEVAYMTLSNVQNGGSAGTLTVAASSNVRRPTGSDIYAATWSSMQSLENFIRQMGARARIYCDTTGTTIQPYVVNIREAAAMPGGNIIQF